MVDCVKWPQARHEFYVNTYDIIVRTGCAVGLPSICTGSGGLYPSFSSSHARTKWFGRKQTLLLPTATLCTGSIPPHQFGWWSRIGKYVYDGPKLSSELFQLASARALPPVCPAKLAWMRKSPADSSTTQPPLDRPSWSLLNRSPRRHGVLQVLLPRQWWSTVNLVCAHGTAATFHKYGIHRSRRNINETETHTHTVGVESNYGQNRRNGVWTSAFLWRKCGRFWAVIWDSIGLQAG